MASAALLASSCEPLAIVLYPSSISESSSFPERSASWERSDFTVHSGNSNCFILMRMDVAASSTLLHLSSEIWKEAAVTWRNFFTSGVIVTMYCSFFLRSFPAVIASAIIFFMVSGDIGFVRDPLLQKYSIFAYSFSTKPITRAAALHGMKPKGGFSNSFQISETETRPALLANPFSIRSSTFFLI